MSTLYVMEEIEEMLHPERWKISYYEKAEEEDKEKIRAQKYSFENKIEFITISQILRPNGEKEKKDYLQVRS